MMHQNQPDITQETKRAFALLINHMISALEHLKRDLRHVTREQIHDLRNDFLELKNTLGNQTNIITIFEYFFAGLNLFINTHKNNTALYPFIFYVHDSFNKPTEITLLLNRIDKVSRDKIIEIINNFKKSAEEYFNNYNLMNHQNSKLLEKQNTALVLNLKPQNDQGKKDSTSSPASAASKFTRNVPDSARSGKSIFTRCAKTEPADNLSIYTHTAQRFDNTDNLSIYTQHNIENGHSGKTTHSGHKLFPSLKDSSGTQKAQKFLRNLQFRFMSIALELNDKPDSYIDSIGFKADSVEQDAIKRIKNEAVIPLINLINFLTNKLKSLKGKQLDNKEIEIIMSSVLSESYDKFQNNDRLFFCLTVFLIECGELSKQQDEYEPKDLDQTLSLLLNQIQNFSENTDPYSMKNFLQKVQQVTDPREYFRTECSRLNQNLHNIYNLFCNIGIKLKETRSLTNNYNTMIEKLNRELESNTSIQAHDGEEKEPLLGKQSSCCSCTLL